MATKIIIYEDDFIFRRYLIELLQKQEGFIVAGTFRDCSNILDQAASLKPDIVLMDIGLPGINGIEATHMLKEEFSDINVMILSGHSDDDDIFKAIIAGADGYVLKGDKNEKIIEAIREVHRGGSPMTPSIAKKALELFRDRTDKKLKDELTEQEFKILELLAQGYSFKIVADELDIKMGTVQVHVRNIYKKLNVNDKVTAIKKVFRWWIRSDELFKNGTGKETKEKLTKQQLSILELLAQGYSLEMVSKKLGVQMSFIAKAIEKALRQIHPS